MGLSLETNSAKPPRILIHGPEGVGKSRFGIQADRPVFVQTEDGLAAYPEVAKYAPAKEYAPFISNLEEIAFQDHDYKTLVIDSVDWLEPLIWKQVCTESGVTTIVEASGGYGNGYTVALDIWRSYLELLDIINKKRQMTIIQIAHSQIKTYTAPDHPPYDRYSIKLHENKQGAGASALLFEYSDIVLFANFVAGVTKDVLAGSTKKNPKERTRGIGSGDRVLYTEERPAFKCKNRFNLPDQIPFDYTGAYWQTIADHIPYYNQK